MGAVGRRRGVMGRVYLHESLPKRHAPLRSREDDRTASKEERSLADIRAMCAIGMRGQLGLNGRLPWEGNKGREYVADVARFFDVTRGHVIIAGPRTVASIPAFAYEDRTICEIRSDEPSRRGVGVVSGSRGVCRRRSSGVGDLRALHPPLGHHPAALRRRCRPLVRSGVARGKREACVTQKERKHHDQD